ncbi:sensor histidine kinase, partial [Bacteroidota bacterium]
QEKQYKKFEVYTRHIKESTKNAHTLLTNLLDWARLQTGSLKYSPDFFDMYKVSEEVLAFADVSALQKKITITNSVPRDLKVYGDKNMINTVLRNLISNAIKYTNINGNVDVKAILQNEIVEFSVKDNGIGISEENIDKLFKMDVNYTTKGTSDEKGTGLGLILCKDFIELHNGKIFIESEINEGTTVKFQIPIQSSN